MKIMLSILFSKDMIDINLEFYVIRLGEDQDIEKLSPKSGVNVRISMSLRCAFFLVIQFCQ